MAESEASTPDGEEPSPGHPRDAELPDLLAMGLAELRTVQHPILAEVLADLRERATDPDEMLWGFNNAF
ncbi:FxSxx-COOH cyclophane-containing RiPP peptide [Streptomyces sp. STR69]|uniref:FxSxx-COOH cyclophane-containing RiPP peptide n=1 Tax=unclassified Streptomyces TaxID=2593676 RepID=UPI0021C5E079|nr:FxSxx-COOH cyclophane-containing RiPP peptide [Streptomyces sp. STR69]